MYKINTKNIIKSINLDVKYLDYVIKSKFRFWYGKDFNNRFMPHIIKDALKNIDSYHKFISALYVLNIPIMFKQYNLADLNLVTIFDYFNFDYIIYHDIKKILVRNNKNNKVYFYIVEVNGILNLRHHVKFKPDYTMDRLDYLYYLNNKNTIINNDFIIEYLEYTENNEMSIKDYITYYKNYLPYKSVISVNSYSLNLKDMKKKQVITQIDKKKKS